MKNILDYLFARPFPMEWLLQDLIALGLSLFVLAFIIRREKRPVVALLEAFAFVFLYASIYENAAIVMGLYTYGRSVVMIGYVPASVPLIEVCVLVTGFWLLEKTALPAWAMPPVIGLFGMLQDLSLDPLAVRQVYPSDGIITGRWSWLISGGDANILNVPVFNFPGWMLIMLYGSACLLVGRWWYRRSGFRAWVGIAYPFLSMIAALLLMISPISRFLLWLGPFFQKGSPAEWAVLAFHLVFPSALLAIFWRGRAERRFTLNDLPVFVFPTVLHISDIAFALAGGFTEILWLVLLASAVQTAFLAYVYWSGAQAPASARQPVAVTGETP